MVPSRSPLLLELFVSSVPLGRTHAGGPPPKGATTTANFRPVGAQAGALWGGRTWERLLNKKLKRKKKRKKEKREVVDSSMPVGGVVAGMEIARKMRNQLGLSGE